MRSFEELMAAKNAAPAAKVRSFDEILAAKQASETPQKTRFGRPIRAFPKTFPQAPESEFSTGEQITDVGRTIGRTNQGVAEFTADLAGFIIPSFDFETGQLTDPAITERFKQGFKRSGEKKGGIWENMKAWGGGFMEPTEFGKRTEETFESPEFLEEQIGEGEGDAWLDPTKTVARIGTELLTTAWMGGPKGVRTAINTLPLSVAGGAVGQEIGGDLGEVIGIVSGALTPDAGDIMRLGGSIVEAVKKLPKKAKRLIRSGKTVAKASDNEIRKGLQELLRNVYSDDPDLALSKVDDLFNRIKAAVEDGKKGTIGQLTGDAGILNFEKQYAKEFRKSDIGAINMQLSEGATSPMEVIAPEGTTATAAQTPKAIVDTALAESVEAEMKAKQPFTRQPSTPEVSTALHETTSALRDDSYTAVKKLWSDIPDATITKVHIDQELGEFFQGMSEAKIGRIKRSFPDTFGEIERLFKPDSTGKIASADLDDISDIISMLSSEANQISKGAKSGTSLQHVDDLKEALYATLAPSGADKARQAAAKAYRQHMQNYGPRSAVGKGLAAEPEKFASSIVTGGDSGVSKRSELLRATGKDKKVMAHSDDYLRSKFNAEYIDGETGLIKPEGVNAFKKRFGNQLSSKMIAELDEAQAAGRGLAKVDKSLTAELARTDDILSTAKSAMTHKKNVNRVDRLTELLTDVDQATPRAREDIRRMFAEDMYNTVTKDGKLTQDGLKKFKRNRDVYEKSGLYTKKELDSIQDGMVEAQKMFLHEDAKLLGKLPPPEKRVVEVMAALGGAKVGAMAFGSPLIGAALGRRFAVKQLRELGTDKINKIAFELAMNPDKFVKEIARLNQHGLSEKDTVNAMVDLWRAALVATRTVPVGDE